MRQPLAHLALENRLPSRRRQPLAVDDAHTATAPVARVEPGNRPARRAPRRRSCRAGRITCSSSCPAAACPARRCPGPGARRSGRSEARHVPAVRRGFAAELGREQRVAIVGQSLPGDRRGAQALDACEQRHAGVGEGLRSDTAGGVLGRGGGAPGGRHRGGARRQTFSRRRCGHRRCDGPMLRGGGARAVQQALECRSAWTCGDPAGEARARRWPAATGWAGSDRRGAQGGHFPVAGGRPLTVALEPGLGIEGSHAAVQPQRRRLPGRRGWPRRPRRRRPGRLVMALPCKLPCTLM